MNCKRYTSLGILLLAVIWHPCTWAAADVIKIPQHGKTLQNFVPPDYEVGIDVRADFNGDGREDIAALLWVSPDSPKPRPLIILLRQANGDYQLSLHTEHRFTDSSEADSCGGGNWNCVPNINAKNGALIIGMPWGSAAGYEIHEKEFRLKKTEWYLVREAEYVVGNISCSEVSAKNDEERCIEQGVSNDEVASVETKYWKFVDDDGKETRVVRTNKALPKHPLKQLSKVTEWEGFDQK
jgi:hypothetical protein